MSTIYTSKCSSPRLERRFDTKSGKYCAAASKRPGPAPASWEEPRVILQSSHHHQSSPSPLPPTSTPPAAPSPPPPSAPAAAAPAATAATTTTTTAVVSSTTGAVPAPATPPAALPLQDMTNRTLDLITRGILIALQERSSMIPVDEGLYKKLAGLFPSVQDDELRQLCKKNYNNELAVMGDLTARGYRPVYTPPASSTARTAYAPAQGRYTPTSTNSTTTGRYAPNSPARYTPSPTPALHVKLGTALTASRPTTAPSSTTTTATGTTSPAPPSSTAAANTTTTTTGDKSTTFWGKSALPNRSYSPCPQADSYTSGIPPPPPQTHPVFSYSQAFSKTPVPAPRSNRSSPQPPATTSSSSSTPAVPTSATAATTTGSGTPPLHQQQSTTVGSTGTGPGGRCYYPGRFVQGVGFEPGSMGGSPQLTGKPFGPLQGRYSLGGMICTEKNSSAPRHIHTVPREPSYPQPVPNPYQGLPGAVPPITRPVPYAGQAGQHHHHHHHQQQQQHGSPRSLTPQPSWYGGGGCAEESDLAAPPTPAPRLYGVVHSALGRHRVTDRSASPPGAMPSPRTYSPVFGRDLQEQRAPTPPLLAGGGVGSSSSSFYATASRLYAQSPRLQGCRAHDPPQHLLSSSAVSLASSSSPPPPSFAHYHTPSRPQPSAYAPPVAPHYQTPTTPAATAPGFPYYRTYSPIGASDSYQSRGSPGSHSPKIKLRYLRRIYPGVDETILLDVLANSDNNVQTAMQELNTSGYIKIETPPTRPAHHPLPPPASAVSAAAAAARADPLAARIKHPAERNDRPVAPPRRLTEADKQKTRARMLERVKEVPAAILTFALESVDFDEERAMILLNNMKAADDRHKGASESGTSHGDADARIKAGLANLESALQSKLNCGYSKAPVVPIRRSQKDFSGSTSSTHQGNVVMLSKSTWTQEDCGFRSRYRTEVKGPDNSLRKGPNRELLQRETNGYIRGHNPENCRGPNLELIKHEPPPEQPSHLSVTSTSKGCWARGNQPDLSRGSQSQLTQGSTYKFP